MKTKVIFFLSITFLWSCSENKNETDKKNGSTNSTENGEHISIHQQEQEENKNKNINKFGESSILVEAISVDIITEDLSERFAAPKFTSDGTKIIFTTENYIGVWVYDIPKKTIQQINSMPGSGYKFFVSKDGEKIYFRNKTQKGQRRGSKYSIIEQNITTKKMNVLYTTNIMITTPIILDSYLHFLEDGKLKGLLLEPESNVDVKIVQPVCFVVDNKLMKYELNSKPKEISLNKMKAISINYTNDYKNIICLTASNGLLLLDLNGNVLNIFDKARNLTKLSNSSLIAFVEEEDDGIKITKSKMYIGFVSSNKRRNITNMNDENIFTPSWSPIENNIVFSTDEGKIKIVELNIKREETK
ncbi:MAG: hypothetical protein GY936_01930 [Ignavibacteriae bacterium]|nr:hypothetical protein [Ignavibacteriota bacterium]